MQGCAVESPTHGVIRWGRTQLRCGSYAWIITAVCHFVLCYSFSLYGSESTDMQPIMPHRTCPLTFPRNKHRGERKSRYSGCRDELKEVDNYILKSLRWIAKLFLHVSEVAWWQVLTDTRKVAWNVPDRMKKVHIKSSSGTNEATV